MASSNSVYMYMLRIFCNLTESVNFWIRLAIIIAATFTANFMSTYVCLQ